MPESNLPGQRVFISYSHDSAEHKRRVLELAQRLRSEGVDAWMDQFEDPPVEGWPRWMQHQLTQACFVLLICTEHYRRRFEGEAPDGQGQGANWEGFLTQQLMYGDDARNRRYVPVLFEEGQPDHIPLVARGTTSYRLPADYRQLQLRLTQQAAVTPVPVGPRWTAVVDTKDDAELRELREEKKRQLLEGHDTTELDQRILIRRRQLRDTEDVGRGTRLSGRFELSDAVGTGGFGSVWRAYDHEREQVVAIKLLHRQYADDRTRRERFLRGARQMASLSHPAIVRVVEESGQDGPVTYFAMEYLAGGDLRQRVSAGTWRNELTLATLSAIAEALAFAHERGLVHRDVKPANILLDELDAPRLADFDLVHAMDTTGGTRTGALGTFIYAAPEALTDASRVDGRADIYSLGMVGIFLTQQKDLPAEALRDAARVIARLEAPEQFKAVLKRACAWDPDERFATMRELAEALHVADLARLSGPSSAAVVVVPSTSDPAPSEPGQSALAAGDARRVGKNRRGVVSVLVGVGAVALVLVLILKEREVLVAAETADLSSPAAVPDAGDAPARAVASDGPSAPPDVAEPPPNAQRTASGLASVVLRAGTGTEHPREGDTVRVAYSAWNRRGTPIKSFERSKPLPIVIGQTIAGWDEGLQLMVVGEERRFWIPSELAFGDVLRFDDAAAVPVTVDLALLAIEPAGEALRDPEASSPPETPKAKPVEAAAPVARADGRSKKPAQSKNQPEMETSKLGGATPASDSATRGGSGKSASGPDPQGGDDHRSPDTAMETARRRFNEGVAAYDAGDYSRARLAFLEAHLLKPHPSVLRNLAQSALRATRYDEAATYFAQYIRENPQSEAIAHARAGFEDARARVTEVTFVINLPGAIVNVDGSGVGTSPFYSPIYLMPGPHKVRASRGTTWAEKVFEARAGDRATVALDLFSG